nr:hypothetical protein Iba_chr07aCG7750 [Ipomoea batatas]
MSLNSDVFLSSSRSSDLAIFTLNLRRGNQLLSRCEIWREGNYSMKGMELMEVVLRLGKLTTMMHFGTN